MTKNKKIKKPNLKNFKLKKKNKYGSIVTLIAISLIVAMLLPYIKDKNTFVDSEIALNQLEAKYQNGIYKDILID